VISKSSPQIPKDLERSILDALALTYPGQYDGQRGLSIESDYIKTNPDDLAAIESARVRRERRAASRLANNEKSMKGRIQ